MLEDSSGCLVALMVSGSPVPTFALEVEDRAISWCCQQHSDSRQPVPHTGMAADEEPHGVKLQHGQSRENRGGVCALLSQGTSCPGLGDAHRWCRPTSLVGGGRLTW